MTDWIAVPCPRCGVVAGDRCGPGSPCNSRRVVARVYERREIAKQRAIEQAHTGLAKCREALTSRPNGGQ